MKVPNFLPAGCPAFVAALSWAALLATVALSAPSVAADEPAPNDAVKTGGFHDESEAGVLVNTGNATSQSFNFKEAASYGWDKDLLKLTGKYLNTGANGVQTAESWSLGLRYERNLLDGLSAFVAQGIESDTFSGIVQRYNTDVGAKHFLYQEKDFHWSVEAGYRLSIENRFTGQVTEHYARLYTEAERKWTKTFSTKAYVEYLPNFTVTNDYQVNGGVSANAALSEIFALKVGYDARFRDLPVAPATQTTDTQFTTNLVAKL